MCEESLDRKDRKTLRVGWKSEQNVERKGRGRQKDRERGSQGDQIGLEREGEGKTQKSKRKVREEEGSSRGEDR